MMLKTLLSLSVLATLAACGGEDRATPAKDAGPDAGAQFALATDPGHAVTVVRAQARGAHPQGQGHATEALGDREQRPGIQPVRVELRRDDPYLAQEPLDGRDAPQRSSYSHAPAPTIHTAAAVAAAAGSFRIPCRGHYPGATAGADASGLGGRCSRRICATC